MSQNLILFFYMFLEALDRLQFKVYKSTGCPNFN